MTEKLDVAFVKERQEYANSLELDYYDIGIDDNGDLQGVDSTDTSILMSLFTDKRANADEIVEASLRRGWFGDLFNDISNYQIGSKIWIHTNQSRIDDSILQSVNDKAFDSLKWMIEDGIAIDIKVNSYFENKILYLKIKFNINNNIVEKNYKLWEQS